MNSNNRIPIILDGDPGHDDALAWTIAKASNLLNIVGITTSSGNQTIEKTTLNARKIMTLLGIDAPIARGSSRPILSEPMIAPSVHGESGLDGPELPNPTVDLLDLSAEDLIFDILQKTEEKVVIVATGPLTNVAKFILKYPNMLNKIDKISMMGGGIALGNWTPAAEFNILVDPEAAKIVFESGVPIIMSGLDVTEKAYLIPSDFESIREAGNNIATTMADWLEFFYKFHLDLGHKGAPVHDAVAVLALINEEIFISKNLFVEIEVGGEYCRGATIADYYNITKKEPNAKVLLDVNRELFVEHLVNTAYWYNGR